MAPGMDNINRPGTSQSGRAGPIKGAPAGIDNLAAVANRLRTPMYVSDRAMPPEDEIIRSIEVSLILPVFASSVITCLKNHLSYHSLSSRLRVYLSQKRPSSWDAVAQMGFARILPFPLDHPPCESASFDGMPTESNMIQLTGINELI